MDILSDKKVKTRKDHRCLCCERVMPKGITMRVQVNTFDGVLQNVRWCGTCEILCEKHKDVFYDDSMDAFIQGCVSEVMSDYGAASPEELLEILNKEEKTIEQ